MNESFPLRVFGNTVWQLCRHPADFWLDRDRLRKPAFVTFVDFLVLIIAVPGISWGLQAIRSGIAGPGSELVFRFSGYQIVTGIAASYFSALCFLVVAAKVCSSLSAFFRVEFADGVSVFNIVAYSLTPWFLSGITYFTPYYIWGRIAGALASGLLLAVGLSKTAPEASSTQRTSLLMLFFVTSLVAGFALALLSNAVMHGSGEPSKVIVRPFTGE